MSSVSTRRRINRIVAHIKFIVKLTTIAFENTNCKFSSNTYKNNENNCKEHYTKPIFYGLIPCSGIPALRVRFPAVESRRYGFDSLQWNPGITGSIPYRAASICKVSEAQGVVPCKEWGDNGQSIGSTVSGANVHSWLWSTATRSCSLGYFSSIPASS